MSQNKGNLTPQQYLLLSDFAYFDPPFAHLIGNGGPPYTLGELCRELLISIENGTNEQVNALMRTDPANADYAQRIRAVLADPTLCALTVTDYRNNNIAYDEFGQLRLTHNQDGFAAYAFAGADGATYLAFRGSETLTGTMLFDIDWQDNLIMALMHSSLQQPSIEAFVNKHYQQDNTYVTGHSKGGGNAAYAAGLKEGITGMGFDAPGMGNLMTDRQRRRLQDSGFTNYVHQDDVVGTLLEHPEKVSYVKGVIGDDFFDGHYPHNIIFDENGQCTEADRTFKSKAMDIIVNTAVLSINLHTAIVSALLDKLIEVGLTLRKAREIFWDTVGEVLHHLNPLTWLEKGLAWGASIVRAGLAILETAQTPARGQGGTQAGTQAIRMDYAYVAGQVQQLSRDAASVRAMRSELLSRTAALTMHMDAASILLHVTRLQREIQGMEGPVEGLHGIARWMDQTAGAFESLQASIQNTAQSLTP